MAKRKILLCDVAHIIQVGEIIDYFDEAATEVLLKAVDQAVKAHGQVVIREYEAA